MRWPAGQCRCGEVNGQVVRGAGTDEVRWLNQRALRGGGSGEQSQEGQSHGSAQRGVSEHCIANHHGCPPLVMCRDLER